jgi:hypothetical protein
LNDPRLQFLSKKYPLIAQAEVSELQNFARTASFVMREQEKRASLQAHRDRGSIGDYEMEW